MIVPVVELAYVLSVEEYDGPTYEPSPPTEEGGFWVEPHRDILYVQVLDENSDFVDVEASVLSGPVDAADVADFRDSWTHVATGEWEVSGDPVWLSTLEGLGMEKLFQGAGRYGYLYLARVQEDPEPGDPAEEHVVMLWELDGQIVTFFD